MQPAKKGSILGNCLSVILSTEQWSTKEEYAIPVQTTSANGSAKLLSLSFDSASSSPGSSSLSIPSPGHGASAYAALSS